MRLLLFGFLLLSTLLTLRAQLTCDDEFLLTGTAVLEGDCIRMTNDVASQLGCAWFNEQTDFTMPFTHTMTVNFGTTDANGADGICIVYQTNNTSICGIGGEGIGAQTIPNSFIIEFDTWQNTNLGDPVADHVAININGDFSTTIDGPFILPNIEDGNDYDISFSWNPVGNSYEVYFDGALVLSGSYDIVANCFGGSTMAYWGFTSSTGGSSNEHRICPGLPPEVIADAGSTIEIPCAGAVVELDGSASDQGPDFTYEWTTNDGNIVSGEFTLMPIVDAAGTYTLMVYNSTTLCDNTSDVTVTIGQIDADIAIPPFLDCFSGEMTLDGTNSSSGNNISYVWSTNDGNIINTSGATATVDEPGEYTLTVIYDDGFGMCTEEAMVLVEEDPNVPVAFAFDEVLGCNPPFVELNGAGSSEGSMFSFEWTTPDGLILNGENTLFPQVGEAGEYLLTVTNDFSGCMDEYVVFVSGSNVEPEAIAFADFDIPCGGGTVPVEGDFSSSGDDFSYEWSTVNGNILSDELQANILVDQAGEYTLVVTNSVNGCTDEVTVTVEGASSSVVAAIATPSQITCTNMQVVLNALPTTPSNGVTFSWSTSDGILIGPTDQLEATAVSIGNYVLTATETATGCTDITNVTITNNITPPIAEAGTATSFGCGDVSQQLNAGGSTNPGATYSWTTPDGNILSGNTSLMPIVGSAGTYQILVTNTNNGCTATDEVVVPGDSDTPTVQINVTDTLDCITNSLVLNAQGSSDGSDGNNYTLDWTTSDGQFVNGQDGLQPLVSAAGTYTLSIVNDDNGCSNSLSVTVVQDTLSPVASITTPDIFICGQTSMNLNATNSSQGNDFTYQWNSMNGQIIAGNTNLMPTIGSPGNYQILVENTLNNCQSTATVVVGSDQTPPILQIMPADTLDCLSTQVTLSSSLVNPIANTSYAWTTNDGSLAGSTTNTQAIANAQGTYQLIVSNTDNNCSDTANVVVVQNIDTPQVNAGVDGQLTCLVNTYNLGGSGNNALQYQWSSPNASLPAMNTLANLLIDIPGTYILQATDPTNSCSNSDTVLVSQNIIPPTAITNNPSLLTCTDSLSLLDGSGSSGEANLMFQWSSTDGSFNGNTNAAQAQATQAGTYQLIVNNPTNGCSDTTFASVIQDANFPTANIALPPDITCLINTVELAGTANSMSGNVAFSWSTPDGNISANANSLQPTVNAGGTYTLSVEDMTNNCRAMASIVVVVDTLAPIAISGAALPFGCDDENIQLDATGSTADNASYSWTTSNGQILSAGNTLTPFIGMPGNYLLTVINNINNCVTSDEIIVGIDTIPPEVFLSVNDTLDCSLDQLTINAVGSSTGDEFMINWSTSDDGELVSDTDGLQAVVAAAGTYALEILNTDNGCIQNETITVLQDTLAPLAVVLLPDTLNCLQMSLVLNGSSSSQGNNFNYQWTTTNGQFVSLTDQDNVNIDAAGDYTLLVTNTANACSAQASATVAIDIAPPIAQAGDNQEINCNIPQLQLMGSNSQQGNTISYSWSSPDGNILAGSSSPTPTINAAGNYTILVTDTNNHCSATDMVMVSIDTLSPAIIFAQPDIITCLDTLVDIDASASTGGSNLSFSWSNLEGNAIQNTGSAIAAVEQSGTYFLEVENITNGCLTNGSLIVVANQQAPVPVIGVPDTLDCNILSINLDASASSGTDLNFNWSSTDGTISANPNTATPTVSESGEYLLLLTDNENGCTSMDSIMVIDNSNTPLVSIDTPPSLTCDLPQLTLISFVGSNVGANPTYSWSTIDGNIVGNGDTGMPIVDQAGTYQLILTNTDNGCSNQREILVRADQVVPTINLAAYPPLDCANLIIDLNASTSTGANDIDFVWTTMDGNILSNTSESTIDVDTPGAYQLILNDLTNGCADTLLTTVVQDTLTPIAIIAPPTQLDCANESIFLDAQASSEGLPSQISWTTIGGQFDNGNNSLLPEVSQPGSYQLILLNTTNNCADTAMVIVTQDAAVPTINFAEPDTLTCIVESTNLDASLSSTGPDFEYQWTTSNGLIGGGADGLTPLISEPGTYILTILNNENECSNTANLEVTENVIPPVADAGSDFELNCALNFTNLNGLGSSQGSIFTYNWTALQGQPIQQTESLTPQISTTGSYQLIVTNTINGCTASDLINVTQDVPIATITQTDPICFGDFGTISFNSVVGGSPPYLYSIDGGQNYVTGSFFNNLPAGVYQGWVEDSNGCLHQEALEIVQPDSLQVQITEPEQEITYGDSVQIRVQSNYLADELSIISWENAGSLSCADCLDPVATPTETSFYSLTVATEDGCQDEAFLRIFVRRDFPIYIPNAFSPDGEGNNDIFYIFARQGSVNLIRAFAIYDRWGNEVFTVLNAPPNDPRYGWDGTINGQLFNSAVFVYYAEIELADGRVEIFKGEVVLMR